MGRARVGSRSCVSLVHLLTRAKIRTIFSLLLYLATPLRWP